MNLRLRAKYVALVTASGKGVAARYKRQNPNDGRGLLLDALGDDPPIAEVAKIVGNPAWSYLWCDGCHDYVERAVRIGTTDTEEHVYCAICIGEAALILRGDP